MPTFPSAFFRRGVPLKFCIIAVVAGAVACVTCLNILYMSQESVNLGRRSATQVFEIIAQNANREISRQMAPVLALTKAEAKVAVQQGGFTFEEAKRIFVPGALQALTLRRTLLTINYGYADGSFFGLISLREPSVRKRIQGPPEAAFVAWIVTRSPDGTTREFHVYYNDQYTEILSQEVTPRYDPRERAWYKSAMETGTFTMTEPYVFPVSRVPGFTAAMPMEQGKGVFSVNILFKSFTELLQATPISDEGFLFILDGSKRILAVRNPTGDPDGAEAAPLLPLHLYHVPAITKGNDILEECFSARKPLEIFQDDHMYFAACKSIPLPQTNLYVVMISPMDDFSGFVSDYFKNTALFSLGTMLIFVLLAMWMAYRARSSLIRLLRCVLHIEDGEAPASPGATSRIFEMRRLFNAVTVVRHRIARQRVLMQPLKETMEHQARTHAMELRAEQERTQNALNAKNSFLATISYEIRTPINAIMGFTRLFDTENLDARQRGYLTKIHDSSTAMLDIINGLLDLAKIETGKLELENVPFHLQTVLDTVSNQLGARLEERNLSLSICVEPDVPNALSGDPTRLHQILLCLLGMAVKATPRGTISVAVRTNVACPQCEGDTSLPLEFQITDIESAGTEDGMRRMLAPLLPFGASGRRYGGAGLGLTVCRELIEMMDGSITGAFVPGQGCAFRFILVVEALEEQPQPHPALDAPAHPAWLPQTPVLVVDDDENNREIIAAMLEHNLLKAEFAANGEQALEMAKERPYALIFMDIEMPIMNGLEATWALRAWEATPGPDGTLPPRTPVVAMTANALEEDRQRCFEAGMDAHLAKPIIPARVDALLRTWIPIDGGVSNA